MKDRRNFTIACLTAWPYLSCSSGSCGHTATAMETLMLKPLTIDLQAQPNLQFRIDAFTVPQASRDEFVAAMRRNLAFIETLPGFISHVVFEKTNGPTDFNIVTIAAWESQQAIAAAGDKVRAYYQGIGFDMPATLARLEVVASLGYYHAPLALQ
jgi:heme-degrading monooxygenase HmoA